jgi:UDP-N-acetylmuramyl pentapeptide synthase
MSVMANKVFINSEDILEIAVVGDQTPESIDAMGKKIKTLLNELEKQNKPQLILDNIIEIGKVSVEARNRVIDLAKNLAYDRLAMLGKGGLLRVGANLLLRATGRTKKVKYFDDHAQAVAWLKRN